MLDRCSVNQNPEETIMRSVIRLRSDKSQDAVELNIVISKWLFTGAMILLIVAVSLSYAVIPVRSQDDRGRKAIAPGQNYSESIEAGDFVFLSGKLSDHNQFSAFPRGIMKSRPG